MKNIEWSDLLTVVMESPNRIFLEDSMETPSKVGFVTLKWRQSESPEASETEYTPIEFVESEDETVFDLTMDELVQDEPVIDLTMDEPFEWLDW